MWDRADETGYTSPTCVVPAASFDGMSIRTVEGHAKDGELPPAKGLYRPLRLSMRLYTPGFLNKGQVLLEHLAKAAIARADLEKTIAEALNGHLCRCIQI